MQKLVNTQKSTNNPMPSFGLIEENIEMSHIHLAVRGGVLGLFFNHLPKYVLPTYLLT